VQHQGFPWAVLLPAPSQYQAGEEEMIKRLKKWWANRPKPTTCTSISGAFAGYPCELPYGHEGRHECVTSVSKNAHGVVIHRKIVHWE
jgi:hypothetical protein